MRKLLLWITISTINLHATVSATSIKEVRSALTHTFNELMAFYEASSGYFGGHDYLWTTANQIETVANYYALTGDLTALSVFENSYMKIKPRLVILTKILDIYC